MSFPLHSKKRFALLWGAFCVAGVLIALAVMHLYRTAQREIEAQRDSALRQESARVNALAQELADAERRSVIAALAALHVDGLSNALRRWDATNNAVNGVFMWSAAEEILPGGVQAGHVPEIARSGALVKDFDEWRGRNPSARSGGSSAVGYLSTKNNPVFADKNLGFQEENLDVVAHDGRIADPWGGWNLDAVTADWVLWYRPGPAEPLRGCSVETSRLIKRLEDGFGDSALAMISVRRDDMNTGAGAGDKFTSPLAGFPGYSVQVKPGFVFGEKETQARYSVIVAAGLLGVFLVGAGFLVIYARRETRDAARKTNFVSQVSHELRTPLTSIRMFADMLGGPVVDEEKRTRFAGRISAESERLGALIERLLAFNTLEAGKGKVFLGVVDVSKVVGEASEKMKPLMESVGMRIETLSPSVPLLAMTDPVALQQALQNLLENAAKYARKGVVKVSVTGGPDGVRVRVTDEGPGVPGAVRGTLFEPFVQGGTKLTDKTPGVGLGLSIARGLMRQVGGDVVLLDSATGAVFEIHMPKVNG